MARTVIMNHSIATLFSDPGNSTTSVHPDELDFMRYIFNVLGIIITLTTLIGNTLVIIAVITVKKLRKVGNVFIINLALSDCLVGLIVSPLAIVYDIRGVWILGRTMCDFWVSMDVICCTASILNLGAISYDRCNALLRPIKYSRHRTFSRAWATVAIIWVYSVLIALPPFLGWRSGHEEEMYSSGTCHVDRNKWYTIFSTIGAFYLPACFMMYYYIKIFRVTRMKRCRQMKCCDTIPTVNEQPTSKLQKWLACVCCKAIRSPNTTLTRPAIKTQVSIETSVTLSPSQERKEPLSEVEEKEIRGESIEPELLAIYQIRRNRSKRNCSTVTESSFGSTFMSFSSDSNTTATTSFSESSDRSSSISTECSGRSQSVSTDAGSRRYSAIRSHRLSSARHSSLKTEVIHELVAGHVERMDEEEDETEEGESVPQRFTGDLQSRKSPVKRSDTDEANDEEESDEPHPRTRTKKLKSSTFRHRNSRKRRRIALSQEKRAAKTLGIVMGCFIVCWLPFFVVAIIRPFCPQCYIHPFIETAVVWLGYFNSACNPFIYSFFNKDFRHAFKTMTCIRPVHIVHL